MSILRKKGKEKLKFKIMNRNVSNQDFKQFTKLALQCLNENPEIAARLDKIYNCIQVYFFFKVTDANVENSLRTLLNDPSIILKDPVPAITFSRKNIGCIIIFLKHYDDFIQKWVNIIDFESFAKLALFEEICHLVEQEGNSNFHSEGYWKLRDFYKSNNLLLDGNLILYNLDADRNHYNVFDLMLRAYPNNWVKRFSIYFSNQEYEKKYEKWKKEMLVVKVAHARLVTDYLRAVNVLYVAEHAKKENLTEENKKLLNSLIENGKQNVQMKSKLIEKDLGKQR